MSNDTVLEVLERVRDYLGRHADLVDHEGPSGIEPRPNESLELKLELDQVIGALANGTASLLAPDGHGLQR